MCCLPYLEGIIVFHDPCDLPSAALSLRSPVLFCCSFSSHRSARLSETTPFAVLSSISSPQSTILSLRSSTVPAVFRANKQPVGLRSHPKTVSACRTTLRRSCFADGGRPSGTEFWDGLLAGDGFVRGTPFSSGQFCFPIASPAWLRDSSTLTDTRLFAHLEVVGDLSERPLPIRAK